MGKKTRNSLKNSGKQGGGNNKESKQSKVENEIQCAVCRFEIDRFNRSVLTCSECKKKVHKGCYSPDEKRLNNFTCDMCLSKKKKVHCAICRQYGQMEMLKGIEGDFIHVECAILSPEVKVQSYSKLLFSYIVDEKKNEESRSKKAKTVCASCGGLKDETDGCFVTCCVCRKSGHFRCWMVELEDYGYAMVTKFLEVCERQNFLLSYLFHSKKVQTNLRKVISPIKKANYMNLAICEKHQTDFTWCPICKDKKKNDEEFFECEDCGRYYHQSCAGVSKDEKFTCDGCKNKNPFTREYKLFDLLTEISKIQKNAKWNPQNIRVLNSFAYGYSTIIQKKISQNLEDIQSFFAFEEIAKILDGKEKLSADEKKKIKTLIKFSMEEKNTEEADRKLASNEQIKRFMDDLQKIKKFSNYKDMADRLEAIFQAENSESEKFKDFGVELMKFIQYFKDKNKKSTKDITENVKNLSDKFTEVFMNKDEVNQQFLKSFNSQLKGKFLGVILGKNFSGAQLEKIIKIYMQIKTYIDAKSQVSQDESNRVKEQIVELKKQIQNGQQIIDFLFSNLKEVKVKYTGLFKEDLYLSMERRFKDGFNSLEEIENFQKNSIQKDVCTIRGYKLFETLNVSIIQFNVMKKKFMSLCKEGDCAITENHFQLIPKLKNFLLSKKKYLAPDEKAALESYLTKLYFMSFILKKSEPFMLEKKKQNLAKIPEDNEEEVQELKMKVEVLEQEMDEEETIFTKLYRSMDSWEEKMADIDEVINNLSMLACMKVKFEERVTFEKIASFAKQIVRRVEVLCQSAKIKGQNLLNISKIINYFGLEDEYEYFCHDCEEYQNFVKIAPNEETDIAKILQKNDSMQALLKVLEQKMANIPPLQVDFSTEIKKMSLLKQWCLLSDKILSTKRKPTINAVQTIKTLFQRTMYPPNEVFSRVCKLENQSKALNKQIMRYLDKAKIQQFMELFQELKMVSKKMNYAEGIQMKKQFQTSNLDITAEVQQLESELKEFENLPKNLQPFIQKGNINEMKQLRKKILECSFKFENLTDYDLLLRRIIQIRCTKFEPPITRKQYFQLLSLGGAESLALVEQTPNLYRAYKLIQKAEQELLNNNIRRRNFANLLNFQEKKMKQLREDLKFDQIELSNVERARVHSQKLREQFYRHKAQRAYIEKYAQLEDELSITIFNNKDIVNQISTMRKEVIEFYRKVESVMCYQSQAPNLYIPQENLLRGERTMLQKYHKLGIRYSPLDTFERDCKAYREIEGILTNYSFRMFRTLSIHCCKLSDKAAKLPELLTHRGRLYFSALEYFHETDLDLELYHGLINQGLELKRLDHPRAREIFDSVFDIYGRVKQRIQSDPDEEEDSGKNSEEFLENQDEDSLDEDEEDEEMDEEDDFEDMDEQESYSEEDSEEDEGGNKKDGTIVLDDSD